MTEAEIEAHRASLTPEAREEYDAMLRGLSGVWDREHEERGMNPAYDVNSQPTKG